MHRAMAPYAGLIYQVFDFYASLGASEDIFSITRNSYLQFVRDLSLANNETPGQRDQDMQLIFESANASATRDDVFNAAKALNREEWVGVLVQLILVRHVVGRQSAISPSVQAFFEEDLKSSVPAECFHDANTFRSDFCYIESTDLVLSSYEPSLRNVYEAFAVGDGAVGSAVYTTKLLDLGEYFDLVNKLNLIDPYITLREVRLNFLLSRMLVIDENTIRGRRMIVQLSFEDFLEICVRMAFAMALPTDKDLVELNMSHAGEYLEHLGNQPERFQHFKASRTKKLGQRLDQPIAHKVRHFVEWMLFTVRGCSQGTPQTGSGPSVVTKKEAERFKKGDTSVRSRALAAAPAAAPAPAPTTSSAADTAESRLDEKEDGEDEVTLVRNASNAPRQLEPDSELRGSSSPPMVTKPTMAEQRAIIR